MAYFDPKKTDSFDAYLCTLYRKGKLTNNNMYNVRDKENIICMT